MPITRRSFIELVAASFFAAPGLAIALLDDVATPEAAAEDAFDVLRAEGLAGFARRFSDGACEGIRKAVELTVQEAIREGGIAEICAFAGVGDVRELLEASDREFVAKVLGGLQSHLGNWEYLQSARPRFLGHVPDDRGVTHVVYQFLLPRLQVVSLQRTDSEWHLVLPAIWNSFEKRSARRDAEQLRLAWEARSWRIVPIGHFSLADQAAVLVFRVDFECPLIATKEFKAARFDSEQHIWKRYLMGEPTDLIGFLGERILPLSEMSAEIAMLRSESE